MHSIRHGKTLASYTKKTTSELYDIHAQGGRWCWAKITLNEEDGSLQIQSDFGDYGYIWQRHGSQSLKHFLISLGDDYLLSKLGMGKRDEFNLERTAKDMTKELRQARRDGDLSQDKLEEMLSDLDRAKSYCNEDAQTFGHICSESSLGEFWSDHHFPIHMEHNSDLKNFLSQIWVVFVKILKKELGIPLVKRKKKECHKMHGPSVTCEVCK